MLALAAGSFFQGCGISAPPLSCLAVLGTGFGVESKLFLFEMTANQPPAAFITGLYETHLQLANLDLSMEFYEGVLGLELGMKEQARRAAFYWVGGHGKTLLGIWEKPPWVLNRNPGDPIITQHFAF